MRRAAVSLLLVALLPACGIGDRLGIGGTRMASEVAFPFEAELLADSMSRKFAVAVDAGTAGVDAVREAVRFEATRYCLGTFGASDKTWVRDPATGDWAAARDGSVLTFQGRCTAR
ncbi:hypothetical protein [Tranquillimonas alkanivorans]|uniref:Uncharacterized protein n=1 Tax=Tranquillimonas alkanivorans TaxID=441119 RepID=A0A1I5SI77_9RHOB|nr:hypothetical protein [Tranquillimonas alkanivorans]SFP70408.1 hypothetical protein SAMN04488047_11128 [Tranquillimonas alkanivorans]